MYDSCNPRHRIEIALEWDLPDCPVLILFGTLNIFNPLPRCSKRYLILHWKWQWQLFKRTQVEDSAIPTKYRELIGNCYCRLNEMPVLRLFSHRNGKTFGATDAEIEDAVHFAKATTVWSAYIDGLQVKFNEFKNEIDQACEHIRHSQMQEA